MNQEIRVYFENLPILSTQGNNFTVGYIAPDGSLTLISNSDPGLSIEILEPSDGKLVNNNNTIIVSPQSTATTLRLKLVYSGFTQYLSFAMTPAIPSVTLNNIYGRFVDLLPKNVYSLSTKAATYADNLATATVIFQIYNNVNLPNANFLGLSTIINNFYPESGSQGWEEFLTGSNRLLYQDVTQYGLLLQHIYRCEINNDNNPYWLAFNISKYIFLWLNKQKYVYISESIIKDVPDAFILNQNRLGNCMFISSGNGGVTYLIIIYVCSDGPTITAEEQVQINAFIRQIVRAGMSVQIDYSRSLASLDLTTFLGNTYHQDPRQNLTYCIQYNQDVLNEALGYTGNPGESLFNLLAYTLTVTDNFGNTMELTPSTQSAPIVNNLLLANSPYTVTTITTTPTIFDINPANFMQYYALTDWSTYYPWSTLLSPTFNGTQEILTLNNTGNVVLKTYLGPINNSYFITIS